MTITSNQEDAPKNGSLVNEDKVTIVDPKHPLFGLTLLLLRVVETPLQPPYCIVSLKDGMTRQVPLAVTDRAMTVLSSYPFPLDVPSVTQLVITYQRIEAEFTEDTRNGNDHSSSTSQEEQPPDGAVNPVSGSNQVHLGSTQSGATTVRFSDLGKHRPYRDQ